MATDTLPFLIMTGSSEGCEPEGLVSRVQDELDLRPMVALPPHAKDDHECGR